jgi:gamma-glutamyl phosphate reductase
MVKDIKDKTKIQVLGHSDGICHIYLDETCDFEKAKRIVLDAKVRN